MLDYRPYLGVAGHFMQVFLFGAFVVGCYHIWKITCRISMGFDLIGRIVWIMLLMAWLLMMFGPERVVLFRILVYASLDVWVFYAVYYFANYPIPAEYLKAVKDPALPTTPIFMPKRAFLRYLVGNSLVPERPWWFSDAFKYTSIVIGAILLLLYGFSQTINGYTWGFKLAATTQQQATTQTKKAVKEAVKTAVDSTKTIVSKATDTLQSGQGALYNKLDSTQTKLTPAPAHAPKARKPVSSADTRMLFFVTPIRPLSQKIQPDYSDKVKPIKPMITRKGRKVADLDTLQSRPIIDTTLLAKEF